MGARATRRWGSAAPVKTTPEDPRSRRHRSRNPRRRPSVSRRRRGRPRGHDRAGASGRANRSWTSTRTQVPGCAQVNQFMGPQVDEVVRSGEVECDSPMSFLDRGEDKGRSWRAAKGRSARRAGQIHGVPLGVWPNQRALGEHGWTLEIWRTSSVRSGWTPRSGRRAWPTASTTARPQGQRDRPGRFGPPHVQIAAFKLELDHVMAAGGLMAVIERTADVTDLPGPSAGGRWSCRCTSTSVLHHQVRVLRQHLHGRRAREIRGVRRAYLDAVDAGSDGAETLDQQASPVSTVFFGGGTPAAVPGRTGRNTHSISELGIADGAEITAGQPGSVDPDHLAALRAQGQPALPGHAVARAARAGDTERSHSPGREPSPGRDAGFAP